MRRSGGFLYRSEWSTRVAIATVMLLNFVVAGMGSMAVSALTSEVLGIPWNVVAVPLAVALGLGFIVGLWRIRRVALIIDDDQITARNVWTTRTAALREIDGCRVGSFPLDWLPWRAFATAPTLVLHCASGSEIHILASASDRRHVIVDVWKILYAAGIPGLPPRNELNPMRGPG